MPHHDAVRRHRFQVAGGVQERLALAHAGTRNADVDSVSGESLGRNFEGGTSARGRLEEEVDDCATTQGRDLLNFATRDIAKRLGRVEQMRDLAGFKFADASNQ